jgi:hypothetical protein
MQALEDSVAAFLCCFLHKPSSVCEWFRGNEVD